MAIYFALGDALVTDREIKQKTENGQIKEFSDAINLGEDPVLHFSNGSVSGETLPNIVLPNLSGANSQRTSFIEIGVGKPLTIEIRHLYTGQFPRPEFFSGKKDMLVSSAIKSAAAFNAAPRAINMLRQEVSAQYSAHISPATEKGTWLVSYTPALLEPNTVLTLEIIFDTFPDSIFEKVSSCLQAAAGIPVFASASFHLIAAGSISKLIGRAGHSLFDGKVAFQVTEEISFERAGSKIPVAGYRLLTNDDFDQTILKTYAVNDDGVLTDALGQPYKGDHPYIVISLDGRENKAYNDFLPTAATAAILDKFYGIQDGSSEATDVITDALKLFNDLNYRKEADVLSEKISGLKKNSQEYKEAVQKYKAYIKNITNNKLLPPDPENKVI